MQALSDNPLQVRNKSMIYVSNKLLNSIFKMNLSERRVLWFLMRDYKFSDLSTVAIDNEISHGEYAKLYDVSLQQAAKEIRIACFSLPENTFFVPRPDRDKNILDALDDRILTKKELSELKAFTKGNIVEGCDYGIEKGKSIIQFTRTFLEHALPVKSHFTQYRLYAADSLTNPTYIALYEALKQWFDDKNGTGVLISTPTALANKLMLPKTYESYPQMRRGFILPAISAINEKTDITVEVKEFRANGPRSKVNRLELSMRKKENFD